MTKITLDIDISEEQAGDILVDAMIRTRRLMQEDLQEVVHQQRGIYFSTNLVEDIVEIKKHMDAITLLLGYYGVPSEVIAREKEMFPATTPQQ